MRKRYCTISFEVTCSKCGRIETTSWQEQLPDVPRGESEYYYAIDKCFYEANITLRNLGWTNKYGGHDLCPTCVAKFEEWSRISESGKAPSEVAPASGVERGDGAAPLPDSGPPEANVMPRWTDRLIGRKR